MPFDKDAFKRMVAQRNTASESDDEGDDDEGSEEDKPYSSLARPGAPTPVIQPDLDGEADSEDEEDKDPAIKQFEEDQAKLQSLRDAQRGANTIAGIGAGLQQIAQGANKPVVNEAALALQQKSGDQALAHQQQLIENRARIQAAIEARKSREENQEENRKARADALAEQIKSRERLATEAALARKAAKQQQDAMKQDKISDDMVKQMKNDLDPDQARAGNMAKNQAQVYQADRLKGLYTEANGDIRNLDSRQMEELAIGLNKMLSGSSSGSVTQVQALIPHTAQGNATKLKEWLLNDPTGTNQVAFVKRMGETIAREREIAANQVKAAQVKRLAAYSKLKARDPDRYNMLLSSYGIDPADIDEKGQYKPAKQDEKQETEEKIKMVDPQGNVRLIPKSQKAAALDAGGKLVDE